MPKKTTKLGKQGWLYFSALDAAEDYLETSWEAATEPLKQGELPKAWYNAGTGNWNSFQPE